MKALLTGKQRLLPNFKISQVIKSYGISKFEYLVWFPKKKDAKIKCFELPLHFDFNFAEMYNTVSTYK